MKIQDAITEAKTSLARYEQREAEGKPAKNSESKKRLCRDHINRLKEMLQGGNSPWHDYGDLVETYQITNFIQKSKI